MNIFKTSLSHTKKLITTNIAMLLFAFLLIELSQHHFVNMLSVATSMQNDMLKVLALLGQLFTSITEYVFLAMLVPLRVMIFEGLHAEETFSNFTKKHVLPLAAEGLRAMGVVILWTILLIIPGIFKYVRLTFVPYVVVADPEYGAGRRDALKYSDQITKGFTLQLFGILCVLVLLEMVRGSFRENFMLQQSPVFALLGGAAFFAVSLFANILLFKVYLLRVKRYESLPPQTK